MLSPMRHLMAISFFTFFTAFQDQVFICKGPMSKVYHKSSRCKGLSSCSTEVYEIGVSEAKRMGRRACKIEYR